MKKKTQKQAVKFLALRLPILTYTLLRKRAVQSHRSVNSQIISELTKFEIKNGITEE